MADGRWQVEDGGWRMAGQSGGGFGPSVFLARVLGIRQ
jgi:hypothetical protein